MQTQIRRIVVLAGITAALNFTASAGDPAVRQPVVLGGKPFPLVSRFENKAPAPLHTWFVAAGKENGDGSEAHPWNDLQAAVRSLAPGDRLRVGAGDYPGEYEIGRDCRDGTREHPIEIRFDGKATILPGQAGGGVVIRRAYWRLDGLTEVLGDSPDSGLTIEGPAKFVDIDRGRIAGGVGPGVKIGPGSDHITISNTLISKVKLSTPGESSVGVEITGDAGQTLLVNNRFHGIPAGAIRVTASGSESGGPRETEIRGNTIRGGGVDAIRLRKAAGVRIVDNTIEGVAGAADCRGIVLEDVERVIVHSNQIEGLNVGVIAGSGDDSGRPASGPRDVTIDHNHFESAVPGGIAIDIEAGRDVRFVNNTVEGCANGILVLGRRPAASGVVVANNLILGVSDTAFVLADANAASLFDYNVFSPAVYSVNVEVGSQKLALAHVLRGKMMPHTKLVPGVKILNRDLAIISGVDTVDVGTPIRNVKFLGLAPDIGAGEQ